MMAKISKFSIALAAMLTLLMLAGRLHPIDLSGVFAPSSTITSCGTLDHDKSLERVLEWTALSLVAILLAVMWGIIGKVLTGAFEGPKYNEFVKGMIWGGIETAALLGLFTALFTVLWGFGVDQLDTARAYAVLAKNTVAFDFGLMLGANFIMGFVTNMNPNFKIPGPAYMTVGFQIAPMFKPILDILGVTMQLITTALAMWAAQEFMLCFIKSNMLVILLPCGFFLRGMGIKAGGNALIAIAVSLFFIYPAMIVMLGQTVASQIQDEIVARGVTTSTFPEHMWKNSCVDRPICCLFDATAQGDEPSIPNPNAANTQMLSVSQIAAGGSFRMDFAGTSSGPNICMYNTVLANFYRAFVQTKILGLPIWSFAGGVAAAGTAMLFKFMNISVISTMLLVPILSFTVYAIMEMVYFVFVLTMVVPLFILFITLTLAKEIAKVLGTEIDLSSLEKLI